MRGLMMDRPLLVTSIMRHAERNHARRAIVSITADTRRHRYTYADAFVRARKLANALDALDLEPFDRVATLAWNDYRHFEVYYAVSCSGRVCHTINPRLFGDQIVYIANHAADRVLFCDPAFVALAEELRPRLETVERYVVLTDDAHMPDTDLPGACSYESLIAGQSDSYDWPELDERDACALCYTSGTTGEPKGVLYDHRATVLHAMAAALPDVMDLRARDTVMAVVPMFHANAWGLPYSVPMVGAKLVFPGPKMGDPPSLHALIEEESVTYAGAVPTVWLGMLAYLEQSGKRIDSLERIVSGGAACPLSLMDAYRDRYGVHIHHAWGMTEMSPLGTYNSPKEEAGREAQHALRAKQGRPAFGVEMKITDDDGNELPWDGEAFGALKVRGLSVCSDYYRASQASTTHDADGWFDTGDVASIDPEGFMQIRDRTKDVIKSGGEWISSIELENVAMAHPAVAEAAVVKISDPKWTERPLLVVVRKPGEDVSREALLAFYEGKVAKWWIPDHVVFVEELPHTATGKVSKLTLRERFADYEPQR